MRELDVPIVKTDMSFSVSRNQGEFEWCGDNINTVFAQRKNLWPWAKGVKEGGVWRMILDIVRFHNEAKRIAVEADRLAFDDNGKPKLGVTAAEKGMVLHIHLPHLWSKFVNRPLQ